MYCLFEQPDLEFHFLPAYACMLVYMYTKISEPRCTVWLKSFESNVRVKMGICPFLTNFLAFCPFSQTIQENTSVLKLDITIIEFYEELNHFIIEFGRDFCYTSSPAWHFLIF